MFEPLALLRLMSRAKENLKSEETQAWVVMLAR